MSPQGHSPHITLSYSAADLHPNVDILPFQWTVRELLLVEGGGDPYRYSVHGRWPLSLPAPVRYSRAGAPAGGAWPPEPD